jgi:glutamate synthase (NADPH/NADH) small chain
LRTSSSHEEGAERKFAINTKQFNGDENGNLCSLSCIEIKFENGKLVDIPGTEIEIPADLVLIAAGFLHPIRNGMLEQFERLGLELDNRGNVKADFGDDENAHATSLEKVFACGDMRRGQSLIVWAIAEGRKCATAVHQALTESPVEEPQLH